MFTKKRPSYLPRGQLTLNAVFGTMVRLGMIPGAHLLSVPGRKSGRMRTTPIYVLRYEGERWLVAGYAGSDWVKNVRAAGWCQFIHDRTEERVGVVEVEDLAVRARVLREFVRRAPGARRGYSISPDAPLEAFASIAPLHPIFRAATPAPVG
jgi:deazaflavin-dependent oxidoreductase (nitroreductase family)